MSKFRDINKKIEKTVVDGYKSIESSTVNTYKKLEDKFVDTFLRRNDETIEEAKSRIKKEQEKLNDKKYSKTTEEIQKEIKEKYGKNK